MKSQKADTTYQSFADFVREEFPNYTDESIAKLFADSSIQYEWESICQNGQFDEERAKKILLTAHQIYICTYISKKYPYFDIPKSFVNPEVACKFYEEDGKINTEKLYSFLYIEQKKQDKKDNPDKYKKKSLGYLDEDGEESGEERFDENGQEVNKNNGYYYNEQDTDKSDFYTNEQAEQQLKENIKKLCSKEKKRLKAVILLSNYELYVQAAKSPADMRKELKVHLQKKTKKSGRHEYETKLKILKTHSVFQFWGTICGDDWQMMRETSFNGSKQLIKLYNKYKKSFGRSPSVQIQHLCDILQTGITDDQYKEGIKNAFEFIRFHKNLNDIPPVLPHDKMMKKASAKPCKKKFNNILMIVALKESSNFKNFTKEEKKFLTHQSSCATCGVALEKIEDAINNREGRKEDIKKQLEFNRTFKYFKPHKSYKMKSCRAGSQDPLKYYTKEFKKYPTELNALYMTLAKKLSGKEITAKKITTKENKTTSAEGKTSDENLDYILSVRCICGGEDRYNLNHLSHKEVFFGRKDDSDKKLVHIDVCTDDNYHISRCQCSFIYEDNCWNLYAGNNNGDENKAKKASKMFYIGTFQMKDWLKQVINAKPNKEQYGKYCQALWKNARRLGQNGIPLKEIACIGIFPLDDKLKFDNKIHKGIKHPLFGIMPYGWFVEVMHPRTEHEILASYIEHSYVEGSTVTEQQKTVLSEE